MNIADVNCALDLVRKELLRCLFLAHVPAAGPAVDRAEVNAAVNRHRVSNLSAKSLHTDHVLCKM